MVRVLVVQTIVPHYRVPVFAALNRVPGIELWLAFGDERRKTALSSVSVEGVRTIPLRNYFLGPRGRFVFQAGFLCKVAMRKYDAVIAEFDLRNISNLMAFVLAKLQGVPFIWWGHGIGHSQWRWVADLRRFLVQLGSAVIVYSKRGADALIQRGVDPEKVFVAANTIDISYPLKLSTMASQTSRKHLLFVGRLVPDKRIDVLIKSFAKVADQFADTDFFIVGDGPERPRLERLSSSLGLDDRCHFVGALYDEGALSSYFLQALLFISAGPMGLAVVHSFAYGVPVVAHRYQAHSPEIEYLAHGVNGLLYDSDTPDEIAGLLKRVLLSESQLRQLSAGALRTAQSLTLDRMVQGFIDAIRYACGNSSLSFGSGVGC